VTERARVGGATLQWGVATHIGATHEQNQDSYCAQPPVFVVADGVGGHSGGEVASRLAVESMLALAGRADVTDEMVERCLTDARARIGQIAVHRGRPPGTTLTGVIVTEAGGPPSWLVVNIGDSRTYLLNASGWRQLSVDHSVVQQLIDVGAVEPSEAESLPMRNQLTRGLFAQRDEPADMWLLQMNPADRIIACSDGLPKEVDNSTIESMLRAIPDPQAVADELVKAAVDAGGHDDVTVLVVDAAAVDG
jgi:PPM family protein phosphatase